MAEKYREASTDEESESEELAVKATRMGYLHTHSQISQLYSTIDAEGCDKCKYGCIVDCHWTCSYIEYAGHRRGCEPGSKCIKFDPRSKNCRRKVGQALVM